MDHNVFREEISSARRYRELKNLEMSRIREKISLNYTMRPKTTAESNRFSYSFDQGKCFRIGIIITSRLAEQKEMECVNSTFLEEPKSSDRKHSVPPWACVAIGTLLYAGIWSYIGILKILSLNAYVFDLGIHSERGWLILHTNLGLHGYLTTLINSGIVFPLSPLTGSGNFFVMVIFQAFSVASVGLAIYFIAKEKGLKSRESMLISFAFFLYFPVYGIMWFDFHYQVFFMPLFMFAYLLYLRKNYVASTFLFFLSGIVRYPYSIFPLAFALIELFLVLLNRSSNNNRRRTVSMLFLLMVMIIWTLLGFIVSGLSATIPHTNISQYTVTVSSIWSRIYVILLFLSPLLFLPVLRVRWIILAFPAFYLFLFSSYIWYVYPHVFQGQYTSGVVPFLFLGLIDFLGFSLKRKSEEKNRVHNIRLFSKKIWINKSLVVILSILIFLNIFFVPFSPMNNQFGDQFNFQQNTSYNPQQYSELGSMLKMIPSSDPYVAYQNNIPEILPEHISPSGALLMGGYLGSFNNVSVNEAINNSWKVNVDGNIVSLPLDFALADASNSNFYLANNSDYSIIHDMYASGKYGILSEGCGLILLQRGYNGTVENYVPENISISGSYFSNSPVTSQETVSLAPGNTTEIISNYAGTPFYLFPGHFTVTLYLKSQGQFNADYKGKIVLGVYSGNHFLKSVVGNTSSSIGNLGGCQVIFSFSLNAIEGNINYSLYGTDNNPNLSVSKLVVSQMHPFQNELRT